MSAIDRVWQLTRPDVVRAGPEADSRREGKALRDDESRFGQTTAVAPGQFSDFFERLVERSAGNVSVDDVDRQAVAGLALAKASQQALIRGPVSRNIVLQVHDLNAEIETPGRRIGILRRDGV